AVAGEPDGGREDVGEREPPEGGVERLPARDLARYADGEPAAPQSLGPWLSVVVEPVGRGGSGRSFPEVEREGLTAGEAGAGEAPASDAARRGVDDAARRRGRDRGIHRAAAPPPHLCSRLRREAMLGGDGSGSHVGAP